MSLKPLFMSMLQVLFSNTHLEVVLLIENTCIKYLNVEITTDFQKIHKYDM